MPLAAPAGVVVHEGSAASSGSAGRVLTVEALAFLADLERRFRPRRAEALARRAARQRDLDAGAIPGFLVETRAIRDREWTVAPTPPALERRRVEITGPVDRKMMINALNSGADAFMADFEDATSPTWANVVDGQANVRDAVRGTLDFTGPDGRRYALHDERATLILRPRGWHLDEAHVLVDGAPMSASLFDFGLSLFHNAAEQLARGAGPYYYLPKLESHLEARLWNDVFVAAQESLGIPHGSVRATVLIETILAAFEMDEILYELRDHAAGLNAGRWDYIFSVIKKFSGRADMVLPDRAQITMTVPFMRAYTEQLVRTCHRRGAHAMGGMAAFVPNRRDPAVTEAAIAKVREDKLREATDGFDGTWVAHPDLVPIAMAVFRERLGDRPNQKDRLRDDVHPDAHGLLRLEVPNGRVTDAGLRANVDVALQYVDAWLRGLGAVAIHNLMEDAATAEIARAQLWQWTHHRVATDDGEPVTPERYAAVRDDVLAALERERGDAPSRLRDAADLLDELVLGESFVEFLTLPAYARLEPSLVDEAPASVEAARGGADAAPLVEPPPRAADDWAATSPEWHVRRDYSPADVARLRGSVQVEHTVARLGAERLRTLLASRPSVHAVALTAAADAASAARAGAEALVVRVRPTDPGVVRRVVAAQLGVARVSSDAEIAPLVVDATSCMADPLGIFELATELIASGAAALCVAARADGAAVRAARLAADVLGVATVIIARAVGGPDDAIAVLRAEAPYADVLWCDATAPADAARVAAALRAEHPDRLLAGTGPNAVAGYRLSLASPIDDDADYRDMLRSILGSRA
ncbi:MAG: malate synthase A [Gemmatirosa sp.]|nr:malate synthase A [Gemmatirosa sp.]